VREEIQIHKFFDNRDNMLRESKKMRKELRASLEDARNRVAVTPSFKGKTKCIDHVCDIVNTKITHTQ
jgi:hypothetical protein